MHTGTARQARWSLYMVVAAPCVMGLACPCTTVAGRGALTVTVVRGGSPLVPVPNAYVGLQGQSRDAISDGSGIARFANLRAGPVAVVVNLAGYCTTKVNGEIVDGANTPMMVTVCGTSAEGSDGSGGGTGTGTGTGTGSAGDGGDAMPVVDVVTISTGSANPVLAFVNGVGEPIAAPVCVVGRLRAGLGTVPLEVNLLPPATPPAVGAPCLSTLTTFSPSRALFFADDPAVLTWTTGSDNLAVASPARVPVPVAVWITDVGDLYADVDEQVRIVHLPRAQQALDASGAGLVLVAAESDPSPPTIQRVTTLTNSATLLAAIGSGCVNVSQIRAQPRIYSAARLNIYYVVSVASPWSNGVPSGYDCTVEGAPEIVFMSASSGTPLTLAHETAHALGLGEPNFGHVTWQIGGFPVNVDGSSRNIMSYSVQEPSGMPPVAFSRGQAARMALTPGAFVNQMVGGSSLRSRTFGGAVAPLVTCPCSTAEPSGHCPGLSLTEETGLMSTSASYLLACRVEPSLPTLSLCAPGGSGQTSQTIDITLKAADAMGTLVDARANDRLWWAVDPSLVSVAELPHPSGSSWSVFSAKVVALREGATWIIVDVGGPTAQASVPVVVKAC